MTEMETLAIESPGEEWQPTRELNKPISIHEVYQATMKTKPGKAVGVDNLPNEILRNNNLLPVLVKLFGVCFENGLVPSEWGNANIQPILKPGKDKTVPLNYRVIGLMSTVAKLYSSILNARLMKYLDTVGMLSDEQNGFRKSRFCIDHLYVLTSIVRNRKCIGESTYACFINLSKAFDSLNRDCLFHKLIVNGLCGKFYQAVKSTYSELKSRVRVGSTYTEWFPVEAGVRQGNTLAPTLFALYLDDLVAEIKATGNGIPLYNEEIAILLYADDIVIFSTSPQGLQAKLDILESWCNNWRMNVNIGKTKVVHFRKLSQNVTTFAFSINDRVIDIVDNYRYLGMDIINPGIIHTVLQSLQMLQDELWGPLLENIIVQEDSHMTFIQHCMNQWLFL